MFCIAVLLVAGCSDDTTNNNNQTGQTLIFTIDSVGIYGTGLQGLAHSDTITYSPLSQNLRVTFSVETNCDTADHPLLTLEIYDTASTYKKDTIPPVAGTYTLNYTIGNYFTITHFFLNFNSSQPRFLRFKDIKFYN